ncbi:hypothetical protein [Micromonospora chersina]|uniref:hypothetical protein n=1 Tax=Micromonospora chersina TaxID=47854 RepID=UPI0037131B96
MARTVKVGLEVDEKQFVRGMDRAAKAAENLDDALDDVAGSAKASASATESAKESTEDLGVSAKGTGRSLSSLRDDARKLDRQIDETSKSVRDLARQIAATSDEAERADLAKKLDLQQAGLRKKIKLRDLIDFDDDGADEAAKKFSARFGARLGPLMASLPFEGAAGAGTALGLAMAPTAAAAVAGAVVGAAGVGGVIGGLALAARNDQVKAAGAALGQTILRDLEDRSARFVPVMISNIDKVSAAWSDLGPDLDRIFSSSRLVDPLVNGAISGAKKIVGGFADAVDQADPVVRSLARSFDAIGGSVGDVFSKLADDADEGAMAIDDLTNAVTNFIEATGAIVHAGAVVKGWGNEVDIAADKGRYWVEDFISNGPRFKEFGWQLDLTADGFKRGSAEAEAYRAAVTGTAEVADFARLRQAGMTDAQIAGIDASGTYRSRLDEVNTALGRTGPAVQPAIEGVRTLNDILDDWSDKTIDSEEANIRLEEAIDRATDAAKRNGDGLDVNKPKQRDNWKALLDIASAAKDAAKKIYDQTGSQEDASAATERGRKAFLKTAAAMGVEKDEAIKLADKLFGIPAKRETDVRVKDNATAKVGAIKSAIASINGRTVVVTVKYETRGSVPGEHIIGQGTIPKNRWGGIYQHAAVGALREAHVAAPVAPARYAYAEPETGGEAFIPRFGNRDRSLDILSQAARWYGQQIMPMSVPGSGGQAVTNQYFWQPQQAVATMADFAAFQARQDALARVGRAR